MIRARKQSLAESTPTPVLSPFPSWARSDGPGTDIDAAFMAGAALAALSTRIHAAAPWSGVWRRRLALQAAVASARLARRGEDEGVLRDAVVLCPPGGDPGPAGRMLLAWRELDRSDPLTDESVLHLAKTLNLPVDDALRAVIAVARDLAATGRGAPFAAAETAKTVLAQRPDADLVALWLADAVLARRLGWPLPVPLLAAALLHPSLRTGGRRPHPGDPGWTTQCCAAYTLAAATACDLDAEFGRRAAKLLAVVPQLRAKRADVIVAALLDEDAVAPSRGTVMSDRARRRLFDRLAALGAIRELSGRATFRLYGL
jgi:Protein of unknown function (DUF1403)